ncbi:MAG: hypothetical protein ACFE9R_19900 [Candidatus Hermodarchaeota archaeon]
MSETKLLDLRKIKELMQPVELLQEKVNNLGEIDLLITSFKETVEIFRENEDIYKKINEGILTIEKVKNLFKSLFKNNLDSFLIIQDKLMEKYKVHIKEKIKKSEINKSHLKKIGIQLIDKKKIKKIPLEISFVKTIGVEEWIDLLDVLKENTLFQNIINRLSVYYENIIVQHLNNQIKTLPPNTDKDLILKFKESYLKNPHLTFDGFLKEIENEENRSKALIRESLINEQKEKKRLEELKKKQEERKDEYQDYLKLSEKEFERRIRKKKRGKLPEIVKSEETREELIITNEVSEKIEKFKSQFEENFQDKFLKTEQDNIDPIDLIRKRKRKNKEEFSKYKEHFDDT